MIRVAAVKTYKIQWWAVAHGNIQRMLFEYSFEYSFELQKLLKSCESFRGAVKAFRDAMI